MDSSPGTPTIDFSLTGNGMAGTASEFGALLRHWRESRRFSQLDLALQANVSSKHVSFLETGRNRPSREMILRLTQAMEVPLRDRNALLNAAGFAPVYRESAIDAPFVERAEEALERILDKQEPYPAIVLDADWNVLRQNRGAAAFGDFLAPGAADAGFNALELLFSPEGLQSMVVNWEELSSMLLMRLWRETLSPECSDYRRALFRRLEGMPGTPAHWRDVAAALPSGPTVDMVIEKDGRRYAFFTTVTTFGTPQDVTLQELRIESYFPADGSTRDLCRDWARRC
jgi:transcriptional regulator with XRE-family HTH domain